MMNGTKKSDSLIIPAKPANKAGHSAAEPVEGSMCVHAEGLKTTRGGEGPCDDGPAPVAFCLPRRHRHPGLHCFRRSIPRLYAPLSTLRGLPRVRPRMTRGQRGSLLLHRDGLAPSTSCRSPGAPRLNGWPARSPADASPLASRPDTHGSGPTWIATPSSYRNSHRLLL